jgi:hypothetical protein
MTIWNAPPHFGSISAASVCAARARQWSMRASQPASPTAFHMSLVGFGWGVLHGFEWGAGGFRWWVLLGSRQVVG